VNPTLSFEGFAELPRQVAHTLVCANSPACPWLTWSTGQYMFMTMVHAWCTDVNWHSRPSIPIEHLSHIVKNAIHFPFGKEIRQQP
jgi:hypothetical protein